MLKKEKRYEFRNKLMEVHKKNIRNVSLKVEADEFEIKDQFIIVLPQEDDLVVRTAAYDFADYLYTSMNLCAGVLKNFDGENVIRLSFNTDIEEASGYMGYRIDVSEKGITLEGYDARGIAQGLYFLEDLMNIRKAPFLKYGVIKRKSAFSIMRATQSPYGILEYPDEILSRIAHCGMDTIEVWLKDYVTDQRGYYYDLNGLCERAEKYGIKVLVEFYTPHSVNVYDSGAEDFYDSIYGELFRNCPKVWAVSFLGEATKYNSSDPHIARPGERKYEKIPRMDNKPGSSGWWPCKDYPDLMKMILKIIRGIKPDAELIVDTYNWSKAPDEERVRLIRELPKEVIVRTTWDNGRQFRLGEESMEYTADYSMRFTEPSEKYLVEAKAVKECGLRAVANANAAGKTWDFGMIPYEPVPFQWLKKYQSMLRAREELNLSGVLENIHYGFHPSIISDLEKWMFFTPVKSPEDILHDLFVRDYGEENVELVEKAFRDFSEAITHYVPTNEDQYGAFRIGPAYPLWSDLYEGWRDKVPTSSKHASHKLSGMLFSMYWQDFMIKNSLPGIRIFEELKELDKMDELFLSGISWLEQCQNPNEELLRLLNMVRYIHHNIETVRNVKNHYILRQELSICRTRKRAEEIINEMEQILIRERQNALDTIPLVQVDSRIGWEPSMEYVGDEEAILWKIHQVEYELAVVIERYRTEIYW